MEKKILVLGGSGYIGTVLINKILERKIKVINIDNHLFGNEIHNKDHIKNRADYKPYVSGVERRIEI